MFSSVLTKPSLIAAFMAQENTELGDFYLIRQNGFVPLVNISPQNFNFSCSFMDKKKKIHGERIGGIWEIFKNFNENYFKIVNFPLNSFFDENKKNEKYTPVIRGCFY